MKKVEEIQITWKSPKYFIEYYHSIRKNYRTDEEAYEAVELIHVKYCLYRRYKNYNTFKIIKHRVR